MRDPPSVRYLFGISPHKTFESGVPETIRTPDRRIRSSSTCVAHHVPHFLDTCGFRNRHSFVEMLRFGRANLA